MDAFKLRLPFIDSVWPSLDSAAAAVASGPVHLWLWFFGAVSIEVGLILPAFPKGPTKNILNFGRLQACEIVVLCNSRGLHPRRDTIEARAIKEGEGE